MKVKPYLFFLVVFASCARNDSEKLKQSVNVDSPRTIINFVDADTLSFDQNVRIEGKLYYTTFGQPGETYKKGEKLPFEAYILRLDKPKTFLYQGELDTTMKKNYLEIQLANYDENIIGFANKHVTITGTIFSGLTIYYIRDLAIAVDKINIKYD